MQQPTKSTPRSGSNQYRDSEDGFSDSDNWVDSDALVEYLHEVDVCAEEDFWWDEEDRHDL